MYENDPFAPPPPQPKPIGRYVVIAAGILVVAALVALGLRWVMKPSLGATLERAKSALSSKDYSTANVHLATLLAANPYDGEARFLRGRFHFETGDMANAAVELRNALKEGYAPNLVLPLLAQVLVELGRPSRDLADLDVSKLTESRAHGIVAAYRARTFFREGESQEAEAALAQAIRLAPDAPATEVTKILGILKNKDLAGAKAALDALIAKQPEAYEAWILRFMVSLSQGKRDEAMESAQTAVKLMPGMPSARMYLGDLLVENKQYPEAEAQAKALAKEISGRVLAVLLRAKIAHAQHRYADVRTDVNRLLKVAPDFKPALLMGATAEYELGAYSAAEAMLRKVLAAEPQEQVIRRSLSEILMRQEKFEEANEVLRPLLQEGTADAASYAMAGRLALVTGQAKQAVEMMAKADSLKPKDVGIESGLAAGKILSGDESGGLALLERLSNQSSGPLEPSILLVTAHLQAGRYKEAKAALDTLETKQPNNPATQNLRGVAQSLAGELPASRASFERALAIDPGFVSAAINLAELDVKENQPDKAVDRLEALVSKQPRSASALSALADMKNSRGAPRETVTALLERARTVNPKLQGSHVKLIVWYLSIGESQKATIAALAGVEQFPQSAELLSLLGNAQMAAGESEQSLATFKRLANEHRRSATAHLELARVQLALKDSAGARSSLDTAKVLDPENRQVQLTSIEVEGVAGSSRRALMLALAYQRANSSDPKGFLVEGDVHTSGKNFAEAARAYRKALDLNGGTEAALKLHTSLAQAGQVAEAEKFATEWLGKHADDGHFRYYMGHRAMTAGDFAGARKGIESALKLIPGHVGMLNNLAWSCLKLKDNTCAQKNAEVALSLAPNDPAVLDTAGLIQQEQGNLQKGLDLLSKASGIAPTNLEILWHYAQALAKSGRPEQAKRAILELLNSPRPFDGRDEAKRLLSKLS